MPESRPAPPALPSGALVPGLSGQQVSPLGWGLCRPGWQQAWRGRPRASLCPLLQAALAVPQDLVPGLCEPEPQPAGSGRPAPRGAARGLLPVCSGVLAPGEPTPPRMPRPVASGWVGWPAPALQSFYGSHIGGQ